MNKSGLSKDEKCPPFSYSLQYWMLAAWVAQSRGHWGVIVSNLRQNRVFFSFLLNLREAAPSHTCSHQ